MSSSLLTFLVLSLLGGYVRRQAPGTEKKTALKVELVTITFQFTNGFFCTSQGGIKLIRSTSVNEASFAMP